MSPARELGATARRCSCGGLVRPTGECDACRRRRLGRETGARPIVHEALSTDGRPLEPGVRGQMESRFGHDFSRVRIHTGAHAEAATRAVDANAFAAGDSIVFAANRFSPGTTDGRRLLAHELVHVVQQAKRGPPAPEAQLEHEAETGAARVSPAPRDRVLRQPKKTQTQQQRQDPVVVARFGAFVRCQNAYQQLAGLVVPGPHADDFAREGQLRARSLARRIFGKDLNMAQVTEIVGEMRSRLTPGLKTVRATANDAECGSRAAYVRGLRPPIVLCPAFFRAGPEQRIRTMTHEAAHLAGIGSAGLGESYCVDYDCETSCGGFDSADSWAHFVHCLSGQTPDKQTVLIGRPRPAKP